jgi:hypothetical protein
MAVHLLAMRASEVRDGQVAVMTSKAGNCGTSHALIGCVEATVTGGKYKTRQAAS